MKNGCIALITNRTITDVSRVELGFAKNELPETNFLNCSGPTRRTELIMNPSKTEGNDRKRDGLDQKPPCVKHA
jgi:hypothetical protein